MKVSGSGKKAISIFSKVLVVAGVIVFILAIMIMIAPFVKRDTPASTLTATSIFCKDSSDETIGAQFLNLKKQYQNRNPDLTVWGGSLCELSDKTKLVSFLFVKKDKDSGEMGQSIALYDFLNIFVRQTDGLWQRTSGDYDYPHLKSVGGGFAMFTFSGGDAGMRDRHEYSLNLSNFEYKRIKSIYTDTRRNGTTGEIETVEKTVY